MITNIFNGSKENMQIMIWTDVHLKISVTQTTEGNNESNLRYANGI